MSRSTLALWAGIFAAPAAWMVQLNLNYALVAPACRDGSEWPLHVVTLAALAIALAGAWLSWGSWTRAGRRWPGEEGGALGRARFMAVAGLVLSAFFAVLIAGQTIPTVLLGPCR